MEYPANSGVLSFFRYFTAAYSLLFVEKIIASITLVHPASIHDLF